MSAAITTIETDLDRFDRTIEHLRNLSRGALLQYALGVGKYLIDDYFDGDVGAYFDTSRTKESSFNALLRDREAELKEMQLSPRTLRNYICAWDVWQQLPAPVQGQLDLTDLYKLATVSDTTERTKLATEAVDNNWSLHQVGTAVEQWKADKNVGKEKRGPKVHPEYILHFRAMGRQAEQVLSAIGATAPTGAVLDEARAELAKLEAHVAAFKAALGCK